MNRDGDERVHKQLVVSVALSFNIFHSFESEINIYPHTQTEINILRMAACEKNKVL